MLNQNAVSIDLPQVIANLKNTIRGKEQYIAELLSDRDVGKRYVAELIETGVEDMRRILRDLEAL